MLLQSLLIAAYRMLPTHLETLAICCAREAGSFRGSPHLRSAVMAVGGAAISRFVCSSRSFSARPANFEFDHEMNFFVASSIRARRTIRPYLEMLRSDPRHWGHTLTSSVPNGTDPERTATGRPALSMS